MVDRHVREALVRGLRPPCAGAVVQGVDGEGGAQRPVGQQIGSGVDGVGPSDRLDLPKDEGAEEVLVQEGVGEGGRFGDCNALC